MIREYAVDPEAIYRNLDSLQRFLSDFHAEKGRVISAIPRKWFELQEEEVNTKVEAMGLGPVARNNVMDKLVKINEISLVKGYAIPRDKVNWFDQATHVKERSILNGIMSTRFCGENQIYDYANLLEHSPENWEIDNTQSVERLATNMADAIENSLRIATTVFYIDPYFDPGDNRFVAPLLAFIQKIRLGRSKTITIHTTTGNNRQRSDFTRGLQQIVKPDLPNGFTVKLFIWQSAQLHDRYILTKNVGYSFGHGLSQEIYNNAINVNINRISETARELEFGKFSVKDDLNDNVISVTGE